MPDIEEIYEKLYYAFRRIGLKVGFYLTRAYGLSNDCKTFNRLLAKIFYRRSIILAFAANSIVLWLEGRWFGQDVGSRFCRCGCCVAGDPQYAKNYKDTILIQQLDFKKHSIFPLVFNCAANHLDHFKEISSDWIKTRPPIKEREKYNPQYST